MAEEAKQADPAHHAGAGAGAGAGGAGVGGNPQPPGAPAAALAVGSGKGRSAPADQTAKEKKKKGPPTSQIPCPMPPGLSDEYREQAGTFIRPAFGRLIVLAGALRRARRAQGAAEAFVPKLSLGVAPQYVKSDEAELADWDGLMASITNTAKRAYGKQCQKAVEGASEALKKYTEELKTQISTLLKSLLILDDVDHHNAAARFVLREPTEADPDGFVKYIHDDYKGVPDRSGSTGHFVVDRSTRKVHWHYLKRREPVVGAIGGPDARVMEHQLPWYQALNLERYIEWTTEYLHSEMVSLVQWNHVAADVAQQTKARIDGLLEISGFKSKPPAPTVPLDESMAFRVAEHIVGNGDDTVGKKGKGKAKGKPKKGGEDTGTAAGGGAGPTGKKTPKAKAPKEAEAEEVVESEEDPDDAPAGAGSGSTGPKGRAPRKSAGGQRERRRSTSRSTAKSGRRSKSPHRNRRSTRIQSKAAAGKETGEGDSTSAQKGGGSGRGKGRSAKPKGSGGRA